MNILTVLIIGEVKMRLQECVHVDHAIDHDEIIRQGRPTIITIYPTTDISMYSEDGDLYIAPDE